MTKKEICRNQNQNQEDDLSHTFQKLSIATASVQIDKNSMQIQSVCLEEDRQQDSLSFSHLHRKILQTKNKIEKKTKVHKYCSKCQLNFVPKGYKNCIKCCFGNSLRQYLKTY